VIFGAGKYSAGQSGILSPLAEQSPKSLVHKAAAVRLLGCICRKDWAITGACLPIAPLHISSGCMRRSIQRFVKAFVNAVSPRRANCRMGTSKEKQVLQVDRLPSDDRRCRTMLDEPAVSSTTSRIARIKPVAHTPKAVQLEQQQQRWSTDFVLRLYRLLRLCSAVLAGCSSGVRSVEAVDDPGISRWPFLVLCGLAAPRLLMLSFSSLSPSALSISCYLYAVKSA